MRQLFPNDPVSWSESDSYVLYAGKTYKFEKIETLAFLSLVFYCLAPGFVNWYFYCHFQTKKVI